MVTRYLTVIACSLAFAMPATAELCVIDLSGKPTPVDAVFGKSGGRVEVWDYDLGYVFYCKNVGPQDSVIFVLSSQDDFLIECGWLGADCLMQEPDWASVVVFAGDGNDEVYVLSVPAAIYGMRGNDYLVGGLRDDYIQGDEGNDVIKGYGGCDSIGGGDGDDLIFVSDEEGGPDGCTGVQEAYGENGNDYLRGSPGNDELVGGAGADKLCDMATSDADVFDGGSGSDVAYKKSAKDKAISIESYQSRACAYW